MPNEAPKTATCAPSRNVVAIHHADRDAESPVSVNSQLDRSSPRAGGRVGDFRGPRRGGDDIPDEALNATHDAHRDRLGGNARRATPPQQPATGHSHTGHDGDRTQAHRRRGRDESPRRHRSRSPRRRDDAIKSRRDERRRSPDRSAGVQPPLPSARFGDRPSARDMLVSAPSGRHRSPRIDAFNRPSPLSPPPVESLLLSPSSHPLAPAHRTLMQNLTEGPLLRKRARSRSPSRSPKRARLFDRLDPDEIGWLAEVRAQAADVAGRELEQRIRVRTLTAQIDWLKNELAVARWDTYSKGREVAGDVRARKAFIDNEYKTLCQRLDTVNADLASMKAGLESDLATDAEHQLVQEQARERESEPSTKMPPVRSAPSSTRSALGLQLIGEFMVASDAALSQNEFDANSDLEDLDGAIAAAAEDAPAASDLSHPREMSIDDVLATLPAVSFNTPTHEAVWQLTQGFLVPMPLGRYGHPYRRGWLWGTVDPRRVFQNCRSGGRFEQDSPEFVQLAREATTLPFAARSVTQRVVVGWAHRKGVLPLPGYCAEPDIVFECRSNPEKVTHAVRRHNTVDRGRMRLYTVWDALDLDCNILLRMSKPKPPPRSQRRSSTHTEGPSWPTLVRRALEHAASRGAGYMPVDAYEHGPRPYEGPGDPEDVFLHLRRCGFAHGRLLAESGDPAASEVGQYIARLDAIEEQRKVFTEKHKALSLNSKSGSSADKWDLQRYLSSNIEVAPVPDGRPVVRTSTALLKGRVYYFGRDGVLRYTLKKAS